jgi:L-ascorbate metabolism protein UlaG (beta-lactamase superfamily)
MLKLTYFGHSCFLIEGSKGKIVIDPFLTGNPHVKVNPKEIIADAVLVTHGHKDSIGDSVAVANNNSCPIVATQEVTNYCTKEGAKVCLDMNIGGTRTLDFAEVTMVPALHSSSTPDGQYAGAAAGFIVKMENKVFYHAGDTALSMEMKLIAEQHNIDYAMLPIGGCRTMDPADAATAVEWLKPKEVFPMHFKTTTDIDQDPEDFDDKVGDLAKVRVIGFGETVEL